MNRLLVAALLAATVPAAAQIANPPVTLDEYPNTDGSTSARPIGRVVFFEMFGVPWERTGQPPVPYGFSPEDHIVMANPDEVSDEIKAVYERVEEHHGTHDAYTRVIHGGENRDGTSLIFECRLPSVDERHDLMQLRSQTDLDCAPIARDAFIFIVNETSKLEGLTLDQVRGIFFGKITNWQEVGGPDLEIEPITRNRNSGSQETMRHLVVCDRDTLEFLEDPAEIGMAAPFGRLHHDRDGKAVAYTFHSYWEHMVGRRGTKALAINGVKPTAATIRSGEYPLCESVYAVIRSDEPENSPTRRLWNWLVTDEGQAIIEKTGYVSRRQAWPTPESDPSFDRATWPRIDGSPSAYPLADVVSAEVLRLPWMIRVHEEKPGGDTPADKVLPMGPSPVHGDWALEAFGPGSRHSGTHGAWMNLFSGDADLIFECRRPSRDERRAMYENAVQIDSRPVARDAFVFIVNENSPVDGLTLEQIRDIYSGEITRWSEVGVTDELPEDWSDTIEPWRRDRNSGSQETMLDLVMGDREMVENSGDWITYDMSGPFGALHTKANAVCFTFWSCHHLMMPDRHVKMLAVDGVYPTRDAIESGAYPLVTDTYVVVEGGAPGSPKRQLVDWLLTEEGQQVIERSGYIRAGSGG